MQMTMIEALNSSLSLELERDKRVLLLGQDIGANGAVFSVSENLRRTLSEVRIFYTSFSESGFNVSSVCMVMYGFKRVAEITFAGFLFVCMIRLVSQATPMRFPSGSPDT